MRTFRLEQSDKEITSHAGMALIGVAIAKFTSLTQAIDKALPKRHDPFFHQALDLKKDIPTEASTRTRFKKEAEELIPLVNQAND